jgi:Tfp pilus assembly protein PilF
MPSLRLKIADFLELVDAPALKGIPGLEVLTGLVLENLAFLKPPLVVEIDGDEIVVHYEEESGSARSEAARLAEKGAKRAAEGDYLKAVELLKRSLILQPSLHSARRDLAMAYAELGDAENAANHLIEVLRLNPGDAWSWVVLGNLYLGPKKDVETAEKFFRKALELKPGDSWALNSLAAIARMHDRYDEAIALFEEAIVANPEFANPYFGKAATLLTAGKPDESESELRRLFAMGKRQDLRTHPVYEQARHLYVDVEKARARRDESAMFRCVQDYRAELEQASGYPVRVEEDDFKDSAGARIQMAWTHRRDHHRLTTRRGYPAELLAHLQAHELTHLKIETAARKLGKNQFFTTNSTTEEKARRDLVVDADKLKRAGYKPDQIEKLHTSVVRGLCGFLYNCPIDMGIERDLHDRFPVLRSSQYLSVRLLADEALQANTNREIIKISPRKILRASLAMNGAYSLFLDELFEGASAFAAPYRSLENFDMAQRLYRHWTDRSKALAGESGYVLVDEFADMLGLRDWYQWKPDPGDHEVTDVVIDGSTNPELLQELHPAAVWHLLSALQRYDRLPVAKVREIAFEVGLLGQTGLDYATTDKKYTLRTIPGESFSGLEMMCLMHAGFRRIAPEMETGMDLDEPYLVALEMFELEKGKES